jgi:hypothetical protein
LTYWQYIDAAAARLPPEAVEAAKVRCRGRELFATAAELLQEFSGWESANSDLLAS